MKIGFLGAGNMAEALLSGIIKAKQAKSADILVSDIRKERLEELVKKHGISKKDDNASLVKDSDIIIIAVKPKDIDNVLPDIKANVKKGGLVISIAAAISSSYIEKGIGNVPVVRVMPNTPAMVLCGTSGYSKGRYASDADMKNAEKLLKAVGNAVAIDEKYMDAVTALSGSGPAYVFLLAESLVEAGIKNGLTGDIAKELAVNTIMGAAKMMIETKEDPAELRRKVTSPGGTTEAAIRVFENKWFKGVVEEAVNAAEKKSRELTK